MEPASAYGEISLGERREAGDVCSAAGRVRTEVFQKLERGALGVDFELFRVPVGR